MFSWLTDLNNNYLVSFIENLLSAQHFLSPGEFGKNLSSWPILLSTYLIMVQWRSHFPKSVTSLTLSLEKIMMQLTFIFFPSFLFLDSYLFLYPFLISCQSCSLSTLSDPREPGFLWHTAFPTVPSADEGLFLWKTDNIFLQICK